MCTYPNAHPVVHIKRAHALKDRFYCVCLFGSSPVLWRPHTLPTPQVIFCAKARQNSGDNRYVRMHLQKWHPCTETTPACARAPHPRPISSTFLSRHYATISGALPLQAPTAPPPQAPTAPCNAAPVLRCTQGPHRPSNKRGRVHGTFDWEGPGCGVIWMRSGRYDAAERWGRRDATHTLIYF
jgi:hypothetical protein